MASRDDLDFYDKTGFSSYDPYDEIEQPFDEEGVSSDIVGVQLSESGEEPLLDIEVPSERVASVVRKGGDRRSPPILTDFEYSRLVETRAEQIDAGCLVHPDAKIDGLIDSLDIAEAEINQKLSPLLIRRPFPDGSYDEYQLSELIFPDELREIVSLQGLGGVG